MLDRPLRRVAGAPLAHAGRHLAALGVMPIWLTGGGFVVAAGACAAAADRRWDVALALWLANRAFDALDGAVARALGPTPQGALLDIVVDFTIYGGFVAAVAIAEPGARLACIALLVAYYVSGTAFLAFSSLIDRSGAAAREERSLTFVGGIAEGTETAVVYVLFCLLPREAAPIAWAFAAAVAVTAVQRVIFSLHRFSESSVEGRPRLRALRGGHATVEEARVLPASGPSVLVEADPYNRRSP